MQNFIAMIAQQTAAAEAAVPAQEAPSFMSQLGGMLPMIVIIAVFIYLMYRGQKKEQKRRAEMIDSIKAGDQILLAGGIYGEVVSVKDDQFVVKIADNVKINVVKTAVSTVVGKEEQK